MASLKQTQSVWGTFKWCTKKLEPVLAEKKKEEPKKEKKKEEPKKKEEKKEEETGESKVDRELRIHKENCDVWLNIQIKFDFEDWKRVYCNAKKEEG